jgi:hypothetical protein
LVGKKYTFFLPAGLLRYQRVKKLSSIFFKQSKVLVAMLLKLDKTSKKFFPIASSEASLRLASLAKAVALQRKGQRKGFENEVFKT